MSATLPPPTKTYGGRPPILPPCRTTFDGAPDDHGLPRHQVVADSVRSLLRDVEMWPDVSLPMLLGLLEGRKKLVSQELSVERMLNPMDLPPPVFGDSVLDYLLTPENTAASVYIQLLNELDEAIVKVKRKFRLLKDLLPPSEG